MGGGEQFVSFFWGGPKMFFWGGDGGAKERPGTDHVTWGPMRGLKNNAPLGPPLLPWDPMTQNLTPTDRQTHRHGNSMTESAQWAKSGSCLIDQAHARSKSGSCLIDQAAAWSKSGSCLIDQAHAGSKSGGRPVLRYSWSTRKPRFLID